MEPKYTVSKELPRKFLNPIECAGCYCHYQERFLIMRRNPKKPFGNIWGIPGGKLDPGETPYQAMVREAREETGIELNHLNAELIKSLYIELIEDGIQYVFHIYSVALTCQPNVTLHLEEHLEFRWVTAEEGFKLPLMPGGIEALQCFVDFSNK